jgi:hypothetical protein
MNQVPKELAMARRYTCVEEFAAALSPYEQRSYDPQQVRDRAELEFRRLAEKWNMWRQLGLLGEQAERHE